MGSLERFKIDLKGLKLEESTFDFILDNDYFESIEASDVRGGALRVSLSVRKRAGVFDLRFHVEGEATVACDLCLEDLQQPVCTDSSLVVRLGDSYSDEDEVITIPAEEGVLDVSWLIYEIIALAIPTRHVHAEGDCNPEMVARIEEMSIHEEETPDTDPRWKDLEKLKSTIKE